MSRVSITTTAMALSRTLPKNSVWRARAGVLDQPGVITMPTDVSTYSFPDMFRSISTTFLPIPPTQGSPVARDKTSASFAVCR